MSDTGVFTKNLCDLYSVSAGAYTTITESELKRATFNDWERKLFNARR